MLTEVKQFKEQREEVKQWEQMREKKVSSRAEVVQNDRAKLTD